MIEKLDPNDAQSYRGGVQLDKLNELIEAYNNLEKMLDDHYHVSMDTQYNTTRPKYD